MSGMVTCLWYDGRAEEAARFYAETFPDSSVGRIMRAPSDFPTGDQGDVLTVEFTVLGQAFFGLNGGPGHPFTQAVSFQVLTDSQEETDRYWDALIADGGSPNACGWLRDKFGMPWQITPRVLMEMNSSPDRAAAKRAFEAMMTMTRLDIAALEAAFRG